MIVYDCETCPITVQEPIPDLVCSTEVREGEEARIYAGDAARERALELLLSDEVVSSHTPFDFLVMARATGRWDLVLERYAAGLNGDSQVDEMLCRIRRGSGQRGSTAVASLIREINGKDRTAEKKSATAWRMNYRLLRGVPVSPGAWSATRSEATRGAPRTDELFRAEGDRLVARGPVDRYPLEAIDYALADAEDQLEIMSDQRRRWAYMVERDRAKGPKGRGGRVAGEFRVPGEDHGIVDSKPQAAWAFALADMANTGVYTDGLLAREIKAELLRLVDRLRLVLVDAGFLSPRGNIHTRRMLERERRGVRRLVEDPFEGYAGTWKSEDGEVRRAVESVMGDETERTAPSKTHPNGLVKKDRLSVELAADELEHRLEDEPPGAAAPQRRLLRGLKSLAGYNGARYQVEHYLEPFIAAADLGEPAKFRVDSLKNSGRLSTAATYASRWDGDDLVSGKSGTNFQNITRKITFATLGRRCGVEDQWAWADRYNVRRCVVAPPGYCIVERDYSSIEVVTFAHSLDSYTNPGRRFRDWRLSSLTRLINGGVDLHSRLAAEFMEEDYLHVRHQAKVLEAPRYKTQRNNAKPVNFGRPGGMKAPKFQRWVRSQYGWKWDLETIARWFDAHERMVPEMREWMRILRWQHRWGFPAVQPHSLRVRGGCTLNSRGNTMFQGPAADGIKRANFNLCSAVRLGRYPVLSLSLARAPSLDEVRARMLVSPRTHSARWRVNRESVAVPREFAWRLPSFVTERYGRRTYWVEDDRLLGSRPFLLVHDDLKVYVPCDREEWRLDESSGKQKWIPPQHAVDAFEALDEIMVRAMNVVVPGKLVQTEGAVLRERWG